MKKAFNYTGKIAGFIGLMGMIEQIDISLSIGCLVIGGILLLMSEFFEKI